MGRHKEESDELGVGFLGWLTSLWKRLPENFRWNLEDTIQPEDISERLLPGEEPQLEINIAWYRDILGDIVLEGFRWVALATAVAMILLYIFTRNSPNVYYWTFAPLLIVVVLVILGIKERIEYRQWRLLKTNARLIISLPQQGAWPLVDNIELKGLPTVLDTNWSKSPVWRTFQFFTGARDLYISLSAYKFLEGSARVGDALIIPDVMPRDVFELKKLVFNVPGR